MRSTLAALTWAGVSRLVLGGACPFMAGEANLHARDGSSDTDNSNSGFLEQYSIDDEDSFMTSDVGGPIADQFSLKAGRRGSTLLEDFIFRQKIQHFDHERVRTENTNTSIQPHSFCRFAKYLKSLITLKNRFLSVPYMLAVLEHMVSSQAMLIGATSQQPHFYLQKEKKLPFFSASLPWLVAEAAQTLCEMSMDLRFDCKHPLFRESISALGFALILFLLPATLMKAISVSRNFWRASRSWPRNC